MNPFVTAPYAGYSIQMFQLFLDDGLYCEMKKIKPLPLPGGAFLLSYIYEMMPLNSSNLVMPWYGRMRTAGNLSGNSGNTP